MLRSRAHLAWELCETPRALEVAMFYCEHPQHLTTQSEDMAAPSVAVRTSLSLKKQRDFGIRRWLADAGCGRDLVLIAIGTESRRQGIHRSPRAQVHEYGQWSYINREGIDHVHPAVGRDGRSVMWGQGASRYQHRQALPRNGILLLLATIFRASILREAGWFARRNGG
jgi:hypothetical protein